MTQKALSLIAASLLLTTCTISVEQSGDSVPRKNAQNKAPKGWLSWRGPLQNGTSLEKGLPNQVEMGGKNWTYKIRGRGTPVIANGRVYCLGYEEKNSDVQEVLTCINEKNGEKIWEQRERDFLSDTIYHRYSIGSPTIDPDTGNVYWLTTIGVLNCFTADGKLLWQHSMMSEYGRLTFPNGRTGAAVILDDMAIIHVVTSGWGSHAPARDRFFAFDKRTGESIWSSTPGGPPKDLSFSYPIVGMENGRQVMYAGLAGGRLVCVDARTGDPIWHFQMSIGGLSTSPVIYKDRVICIHGKENLDASHIGRMVAVKRGTDVAPGKGPVILDKKNEIWRNLLCAFTSSPVLVGNRIYQTVLTGDLHCVDADTGKSLWHEKLAPDQIHASPAYGDGKLYVPMNNGSFYILEPGDEGAKVLQKLQLEGNCLGAPAIANGKIYVHTTEKLYSFGGGTGEVAAMPKQNTAEASAGSPIRLQVIPADVVFKQGSTARVRVRSLDAKGLVVDGAIKTAAFDGLPAKGVTIKDGVLQVAKDASPFASVVRVEANGLKGTMRLRVVPSIPFSDNFDNASLKPHAREEGVLVAPPRPYWVGAKLKWEIRELDGNKVLAKTLDQPLFQRTMSMIGHPKMSNYTMQVDIRTDGNRRIKSSAGVVNQRYLIWLKGNYDELEVSSNVELLKKKVPFKVKARTWYRLKTRVDVAKDGSGVIRAKVWQRDKPEPAEWTIEVPHPNAHKEGSPGIYGFVPQSRFMVYLDNLKVTSND